MGRRILWNADRCRAVRGRDLEVGVINVMDAWRVYGVVLWLTIAISSCSVSQSVLIYNNVGESILVRYRTTLGYRTDEILQGEFLEVRRGVYEIIDGGCRVTYQPEGMAPIDYIEHRGFFRKGRVRVQVEADWRVFILRPGDRPPIKVRDYSQPEGYPLLSTRECPA